MFKRQRRTSQHTEWSSPTKAVQYPKWSYVTADDEYYLIMEKTKKKFISKRAALSWSSIFLPGTRQSISNYPLSGQLGFRSGTIVQVVGEIRQYFISDNKRQKITTPDFYTVLGYNANSAVIISLDELDWHLPGEAISSV